MQPASDIPLVDHNQARFVAVLTLSLLCTGILSVVVLAALDTQFHPRLPLGIAADIGLLTAYLLSRSRWYMLANYLILLVIPLSFWGLLFISTDTYIWLHFLFLGVLIGTFSLHDPQLILYSGVLLLSLFLVPFVFPVLSWSQIITPIVLFVASSSMLLAGRRYYSALEAQRRADLATSRERYRLLSELTSDYAYMLTVTPQSTLRLEWASEAFMRITNYSLQDINSTNIWHELIFPEDLPRLLESRKHLLAGQVTTVEYRIVTRDGSIRWLRDYTRPVLDSSGKNIIAIYGAAQDISERKAYELELEQHRLHLRQMVNERTAELQRTNIALQREIAEHRRTEVELETNKERYRIISELAADYSFSYVVQDDRYVFEWGMGGVSGKVAGYSTEELLQREWYELLMPDDLSMAATWLEQLLSEGALNVVTTVIGGDQKTYRVNITIRLITDTQGNPLRVYGSVQDTTSQWRYETALRESEQRYRLLAESITDIVTLYQLDGTVTYVSPSALRTLGYTTEEMLSTAPASFLHPDDLPAFIEAGVALMARRGDGRVEGRIRRKDGSYLWVETSLNLIQDNAGAVSNILGVSRDISERKRVQQQLSEAKLAAESASHAKTMFLANMSHELRTPLNSILGMAQVLMMQNIGQLLPRQIEYLQDILDSGRHLLRLVNDILDLSRIERGRIVLQVEALNLVDVLEEAVSMLREPSRAKTIQLSTQYSKADLGVKGDRHRIIQIAANLLSNAIKFTPAGGQIILSATSEGKFARIEVRDTGIGISPENQERLFHPFERLDLSLSSQYDGSGLGLALSRQLVELQGGSIGVWSVETQGATFWFTLPLSTPPADNEYWSR